MEENEGCQEMKTLGASEKELLSVLRAQLLSVLQFATPAWSDPHYSEGECSNKVIAQNWPVFGVWPEIQNIFVCF